MNDIEKIKDRIRKLLVRREDRGATPAEAAQAIELALKMLNKYGLSMDEFQKPEQADSSVQLGTRRPRLWAKVLADSIGRYFGCQLFQRDHWHGAVFLFRGEVDRASVASWLYMTVQNELYIAATRWVRSQGHRRHAIEKHRCSWLDGATLKISMRLDPPKPRVDDGGECRNPKRSRSIVPAISREEHEAMLSGYQFAESISLATNAVGSPQEQRTLEYAG